MGHSSGDIKVSRQLLLGHPSNMNYSLYFMDRSKSVWNDQDRYICIKITRRRHRAFVLCVHQTAHQMLRVLLIDAAMIMIDGPFAVGWR